MGTFFSSGTMSSRRRRMPGDGFRSGYVPGKRKPVLDCRQSVCLMYDVVVVGAGPGGSAAAAALARQGFDTLLLDKADFPRDKTCGDALTPRAVRMLDTMGLLPHFAGAQRITEAVVVAP